MGGIQKKKTFRQSRRHNAWTAACLYGLHNQAQSHQFGGESFPLDSVSALDKELDALLLREKTADEHECGPGFSRDLHLKHSSKNGLCRTVI